MEPDPADTQNAARVASDESANDEDTVIDAGDANDENNALGASGASGANVLIAKLLQEQVQAREAQAPKAGEPPAEPMYFGMTLSAILVAFVISTIGLGFVTYGRSQRNIVYALFGVVMMAVPFFLTSMGWLLLVGGLLIAVPLLMKKLQMI